MSSDAVTPCQQVCLMSDAVTSCQQVCLMSRDMQNVLVTTFTELKQCFERSFRELFEASLAKDPPAA